MWHLIVFIVLLAEIIINFGTIVLIMVLDKKRVIELCEPSFSSVINRHLSVKSKNYGELVKIRDSVGKWQNLLWAHFVKNHPTKWKRIHTDFINTTYKKTEEILVYFAKHR